MKKSILIYLFLGIFNFSNAQDPYFSTNDRLGKYGYLEKNATISAKINSNSWSNVKQMAARMWNGSEYVLWGSAINQCNGNTNQIQFTNDYDLSSYLSEGQTVYTKVRFENCSNVITDVNSTERQHVVFDISDNRASDLSATISPVSGIKNVVLSTKITFGSLSDRNLTRFWIQNVGNLEETTHIANDGFKIYYEPATGTETFDGNENFAQIYGDYNSNSTSNNYYGHDALNINIPAGGLRIYVVLDKFNGCTLDEKNVHIKIIDDGLSFSPNINSSFNLARVNEVVSNSITKPLIENCNLKWYKTKQSGNSSDISTWLTSIDNINWHNAFQPPINTSKVLVDNGHTLTINQNENYFTLTINSATAFLTVSEGKTLTIENFENLGTASNAICNNNSSLIITNSSIGSITYNRSITLSNTNDYVYYSSPVTGGSLANIPDTNNWFKHNQITNNWTAVSANAAMDNANGYIVRYPTSGTKTASFIGTPNKDNYILSNLSKYIGGGTSGSLSSVLIGNPYPAAIDINMIYEDNQNLIAPTFYFWTHTTQYAGGATYSFGDYATYNAVIGAGTGTSSAGSTSGSTVGNRYIAAGQSVFVDMASTADNTAANNTLVINNDTRVTGNNSQFYRTNSATTNSIASEKIWFNITNSTGLFKQVLLAYAQTASNLYDYIDAVSYDGQSTIDFYTISDAKKMVIQARSFPFVSNDVVNLGYKTAQAGAYQISIDHLDASWDNQPIFIKDNLLNVVYDIKANPYNFTTNSGTFDNRFEIVYQSNALNTNAFNSSENTVFAYINNQELNIGSTIENIKNITLFDALGRSFDIQKNIYSKEVNYTKLSPKNHLIIAEIELENGIIISKKIIY